MGKKMYTYKARINGSEPLYKTIVIHAYSEKEAEVLALTKITGEWSSVYSPGKDTVQLELISVI